MIADFPYLAQAKAVAETPVVNNESSIHTPYKQRALLTAAS